ncbi:hypothetical protein ABFX02_07G062000 [Erythranthe guttata]
MGQSQSKMEGESSEVHEFPEEIIEEILKRLPVKPLVRFRCVSKSWLSIISSPVFIKLHLDTSLKNNTTHSHTRLICVSADPQNHFRIFPLRHLMDEEETETETEPITSVSYNAGYPDVPMRIVGSCRGMVCVALNEEKFYLWNPSIRRQILLPPLNIRPEFDFYMKDGFGYEEFTDDYKVVAILFCNSHAGPFKVEIFSLRANAWKRIEDFKYGNPLDNSGVCLNGKLHWLVDEDSYPGIVSLDLFTEEYARVGPPYNASDNTCAIVEYDEPCLTLGLFNGCLCMLSDDHRTNMDLWVMKDYGVVDSWDRVVRVSHLGNPGFYPHVLRVIALDEDRILFLYGCVVVVYSLKNCSYWYPPTDSVAAVQHADVFVESLISPCAYEANRM